MNKHIKSIISIIIALAMIIPGSLPVFADDLYGFKDFPTGWSKAAMSHAVGNGLIYGKSSDRIAPEDNLTRAEMATIINRAFGATVEKDISAFSDVSASAWYYKEIAKAYNMQTLYGDAGGTMRPDEFIIREEAITIVARAMVLSGYSAANLDRFKDKADISDWAIDSLASMAANGYVNGDEDSNMNPKAFITREEFAQLLYNIIKHYYNPENTQEAYKGNLMLNKPDISLEKIKIEGDLILGDGVGESEIKLTNVEITGRLLVRGAAQITLKNVTVGGGVTVKNVNGTVHFDNYQTEEVFEGINEYTKVTYKQKTDGGGGGGGGGGDTPTPKPQKAKYHVEHYRESLDGTSFELFETNEYTGNVDDEVTAVAKVYDSATGENEDYVGFSEDTDNEDRKASGKIKKDGSLTLKLYYTRDSYKLIYDYGDATTKGDEYATIKYGHKIKFPASDTFSKEGGYNFTGWYSNKDYKAEDLLNTNIKIQELLDVKAGETEVTIYAKWEKYYVVTFFEKDINNNYTQKVGDSVTIVIEDAEKDYYVQEGDIPGKDKISEHNRYEEGYFKNSSISDEYDEEYKHLIYGVWCYYDDDNKKYVEFTSNTKIEKDLSVCYMFRYAKLGITISGEELTLEMPFENDTRVIDTVKDAIFNQGGKIINAFNELDVKGKLNSAYYKLVEALNEKGIELTPDKLIADDGEILKLNFKLNVFEYIDEETMKTTVVNEIKDTFSEKPELMRGVIDEMLKEQDEDVVNLMDGMLVSMLSGSDAQRIKDIIAEQVVKTLKNSAADTKLKEDIKGIITSEVEREINLPESEQKILPAIKTAITEYLNDSANNVAIKELISGLIDDAYQATDENDPVRKFVKAQMTAYLSNDDALEDVITRLMNSLDENTPEDNYLVTLITKILNDDNYISYVEEFVDIIFTQYDSIDGDLKDFIIEELSKELSSDADELEAVIEIVMDLDKEVLKGTFKQILKDDAVFEEVANEALKDDTIFEKVINKAIESSDVLDVLIQNQDLYEVFVDAALNDSSLTQSIANTVFDNTEALKSILIAIPDNKVSAVVDKIVESQGQSRIETILAAGLTDDPADDNDYYSVAYRAVLDIAIQKIEQELAGKGFTDDPNDSNDLYDIAKQEAIAIAISDIESKLSTGITKDTYPEDWNDIITAAKGVLKTEITNNFDSEVAIALSNPSLVAEIKAVALSMLSDTTTGIKSELGNYAKGLGEGSLKNEIIAVVKSNRDAVNSIISSLKTNQTLRPAVTQEAIDALNDNETIRATIIDEVAGDVLESQAKDILVNKLVEKINNAMDAIKNGEDELGENKAFLDSVIEIVTDDIDDKQEIRNATRDLLKELMKETEEVNGTPVLTQSAKTLKTKLVNEVVTFVLINQTAKAEAVEMIISRVSGTNANSKDREEAINFAFNALADENARNAILDEFFGFILSASNRAQFAANVLDTMFDAGTTVAVRNKILNIGFEKLLTPKTDADVASLTSIIDSAIDTLANQDVLRREMIVAVISSDDGRESIVNILFEELERDATFIDDMVDIAMKGKYGDLVEKLIHEVVTLGKFEINGDNAYIAEQVVIPMLNEITADIVLDRIPEKISKYVPKKFVADLFDKFMNKFKTDLQTAVSNANAGTPGYVSVMIDTKEAGVDLINGIFIPMYEKLYDKLRAKACEYYYYEQNPYVQEIVELLDINNLFTKQTETEVGTGYKLKSNTEYYEMLRNMSVLADDAAGWYLDEISDDQINSMIARLESALTRINELVGNRIPQSKLDTLVDYMKKLVDKREKIYNVTTTDAFDKMDMAYDKIVSFIKAKTGADISIGATVEVTFDGSGLTVNGDQKVDINNYDISVTVGGNTFKIDSHSVTIAGQTIDISGYVQKIADTFGTKTVTVKFTEDAGAYSFNVGNNTVVLDAYYS